MCHGQNMVWFPRMRWSSMDADLDSHYLTIFWSPTVGWMTLNHIPCFDRGTYGDLICDLFFHQPS